MSSIRQRRWHLEPKDRKIYLSRDGQEASSFAGLRMGPIKDISIGKELAKGSKQALLLLFEHNSKGIVSRDNFEWNKNEFSRKFKQTKNASEFIDKFQSLTSFDKVHQVAVLKEQESVQPQETLNEDQVSIQSIGDQNIIDSVNEEVPPPAKKQKRVETIQIGNIVDSKKVGLLDILVKNCDEPPTFRLLRRVDPVFVEALKLRLKEDSSGIGIPPLAVVCKDVQSKSNFEARLKDVYRYEVHGGLHGIKARQELNAEGHNFAVVSCHVYVGLSDEEALWLASRHNANGHFQHQMTHRDYVEACRSRLYVLNGKNPRKDETPSPTADWKRTCTKCILPEGFSRTQRENIFSQAVFAREVWEKVLKVMDMYEDGSLKNQKLNKRHLTSIPEFKQHLLQPIHHLNTTFQLDVLEKVIEEELSLKELKAEAIKFRALEAVRQSFLRCTNLASWDDAIEKYEAFTDEDRLMQFVKLDFRHNIPDTFKAYCQSALNSEMPTFGKVRIVNGVRVALVNGALHSLSASDLREVDPTYIGAQLIVTRVPEACDTDIFEKIAYTSRQLNSSNASLPFFNLVVLCGIDQMDAMKAALLKCFDSVEVAYAYNKSAKEAAELTNNLLTPAIKGIVVGHWSQDGVLQKRHINEPHHDVFVYTSDDDSLLQEIVTTFSYDGQAIVDATETGSTAAVTAKRNLIAIYQDPVMAQEFLKKLEK